MPASNVKQWIAVQVCIGQNNSGAGEQPGTGNAVTPSILPGIDIIGKTLDVLGPARQWIKP